VTKVYWIKNPIHKVTTSNTGITSSTVAESVRVNGKILSDEKVKQLLSKEGATK
jgi:hypothetical protein